MRRFQKKQSYTKPICKTMIICEKGHFPCLSVLRVECEKNDGMIESKEVKCMKTSSPVMPKIVKALAEKALKRDANSTSCGYFYQPKAPESLKRYKNCKK